MLRMSGTFGGSDFMHSLLGEATDHIVSHPFPPPCSTKAHIHRRARYANYTLNLSSQFKLRSFRHRSQISTRQFSPPRFGRDRDQVAPTQALLTCCATCSSKCQAVAVGTWLVTWTRSRGFEQVLLPEARVQSKCRHKRCTLSCGKFCRSATKVCDLMSSQACCSLKSQSSRRSRRPSVSKMSGATRHTFDGMRREDPGPRSSSREADGIDPRYLLLPVSMLNRLNTSI
jgi:hypothetical protein